MTGDLWELCLSYLSLSQGPEFQSSHYKNQSEHLPTFQSDSFRTRQTNNSEGFILKGNISAEMFYKLKNHPTFEQDTKAFQDNI